jgi:putative membrane protein
MSRNARWGTGLLVLAVLGLVVVLPPLALAGVGWVTGGVGPMMSGAWGGHEGWTSWWVFLVGAGARLLWLGALLAVGYLVYRAVTGDEATDPALEALRTAYARGELGQEEYERRRETLTRDEEE